MALQCSLSPLLSGDKESEEKSPVETNIHIASSRAIEVGQKSGEHKCNTESSREEDHHDAIPGTSTEEEFLERLEFSRQDDTEMSTLTAEIDQTSQFQETSVGAGWTKYVEMFKKPVTSQIEDFFKFHPQLPTAGTVPFDINKAFKRTTSTGTEIERNWLTFDNDKKAMYCSLCLVYANTPGAFTTGLTSLKHVHQRIQEHEGSLSHLNSVEAYLLRKTKGDIVSMAGLSVSGKRKKEIQDRRAVVKKLVRIILFIGKKGLAYRGKRHEGAHELRDDTVNHGNYLELVKLIAESDEKLNEHIDKIVQTSKRALAKRAKDGKHDGNYGRGSLVTFLSHDITNRIINIVKDFIQGTIIDEAKRAGMFSVEMDTTQDITTQDQCSIVLRYVHDGEVHERLLSLVKATSTSGESLFLLLKNTLEKHNLDIRNCVGDSFDGAPNMSGIYNGVAAKISNVASLHVHTWCYSHSLNLVLSDAASTSTLATSLFGILQKSSTFFRQAHKRMDVWEQTLEKAGRPSRRLGTIGETRWLSKSQALTKIFGTYSAPDQGLYAEMLLALDAIANDNSFQESTRSDAKVIMDHFQKFETIITAFIFLRVYSITTPLSLYPQTKGLDMLQAWRMVETTAKQINDVSRDFERIHMTAKYFFEVANEALEESNLEVGTALPKKRVRRKKRLDGEQCQDEAVVDELESFKVNTFNLIMDRISTNMKRRFLDHEMLYKDFSCFDPKRFKELRASVIPAAAMAKICDLLGNRVDKDNLSMQLESFVNSFPRLAMSLPEEFEIIRSDEVEDGAEADVTTCKQTSKRCFSCFTCAYKVLHEHNLNCVTYSQLYTVYQFLLTLAVTQVECERNFSKLKLIKTRLRSSLSQENLESFMLMSIESKILSKISSDKVVDKLATTSKEMNRLLLL